MKAIRSLLVALALFAAFAAADDTPRICPACDHEVEYDEQFCHTCGGDLSGVPVPGAAAVADPEPASVAGEGALAAAVRADVSFARAPGRGAFAALAALRNAMALVRLEPDAVPAAPREALLKRAEAFFASCAREMAPCPLCGGKGSLKRKPPPKRPPAGKGTLEASIVDIPVNPQPYICGLCGGHGKAPRVRDRKGMADAMRLGVRDFRRVAEAAGREEHGGVFVPAAWYEALPQADRARVDRAAPPDCGSCAGTGTVPCRKCGGFGRIACPDAAGHATPKPIALKADRGKRIEDYQYEAGLGERGGRCRTCGGKWDEPGAIPCPDCGGKGLSACPSCGGSGHGR